MSAKNVSKSGIRFFDANAVIGRAAAPPFGAWLSGKGLLAEMERLGIEDSLITHVFCQELDGSDGNLELFEAASISSHLHLTGTIFPAYGARATERVAQELDALQRAGCVAIRLHPNPTHHIMDAGVYERQYELTTTMAGPVLEALADRGLPLFVELAQTNWSEIDQICAAFPTLAVVVLNVSYTNKRSVFAMFDAHENFTCDTSGFHAYRAMDEVCESFGGGRMVFGSRSPVYDPLAAMALILYADISDEAKADLAGGNLARILGVDW